MWLLWLCITFIVEGLGIIFYINYWTGLEFAILWFIWIWMSCEIYYQWRIGNKNNKDI